VPQPAPPGLMARVVAVFDDLLLGSNVLGMLGLVTGGAQHAEHVGAQQQVVEDRDDARHQPRGRRLGHPRGAIIARGCA